MSGTSMIDMANIMRKNGSIVVIKYAAEGNEDIAGKN
jgi:hypothetical protein